jgi:hypothetical protein
MSRLIPLALLLLVACSGQSSVDDNDKRDDCERLRDITIDLRLRTAPRAHYLSAADLERHRATMLAAAGDRFVTDCREQRTEAELTCALAATNSDALRACLPQPETR